MSNLQFSLALFAIVSALLNIAVLERIARAIIMTAKR